MIAEIYHAKAVQQRRAAKAVRRFFKRNDTSAKKEKLSPVNWSHSEMDAA